MKFLPDLLASIMQQTYKDFNILVIDNGSSDNVEAYLKENYPEVTMIRNARNLGFSVAHNQGIRYALDHWDEEDLEDRYVLVTNPDTIFSETFLEELMASVHEKQAASFGGKLLRAFGSNQEDETLKEIVKSDLIDTTGLRCQKNRTVFDRGAGELDKQQYDQETEVFGLSGALVLYRASALRQAQYQDEFFDNDFFAYKEDVDLAWRFQHLGFKALYVPLAVAHHYRGIYGKENMGFVERIKNRLSKSGVRNFYSTRNHVLMLIKNLRLSNAILAAPRLIISELVRFFYVLFFEPKNLLAYLGVIKGLAKMLRKRKHTLDKTSRSAKELRAWFK